MKTMLAWVSLLVSYVGAAAGEPLRVHLIASRPSPQPVGISITIVPRIENLPPGPLASADPVVVRYSVSLDGGPFRIVRDFSQQRDFVWSPPLYEHDAMIRATIRNNKSRETAESELPFRVVSRVKGSTPAVTRTAHPLVALFSSPPCPEGTRFRVAFRREGDEATMRTSLEPCRPPRSSNVYVAGMRPDSDYLLRSELVNGDTVKPGSWMPFRTALLDGDFPPVSVPIKREAGVPVHERLLINSAASVSAGSRPFATDMDGEIVWYAARPEFLTRVLPGSRFLGLADGMNSVNTMTRLQVIRVTDLAGNVIQETNIARVAEQLEQRGIHSDCRKGGTECVSGFHHDAIRLPNGHTLAIAGLERMFPAGTQGSKEPLEILGDLVIELDNDFQVTGVWNSFDHLDINRAALDKGKCKEGAGSGGCPPIFLTAEANAWLHSNSLHYLADSGDFLLSMRAQSWVAKVDWKNGKGSGKILWRLGEGGDFTARSSDPHPWFDSQHDPGFDLGASNILSVFDNGNLRHEKDASAHTRGQAWKIDEQARTATLVHNADLGVYSVAVGSAQLLKTGGYSFQAGFVNPTSIYTRAVETSPDGKVVYAQQVDGLVVYRSFRVPDLYTAPGK
jgi:hypothetical protein